MVAEGNDALMEEFFDKGTLEPEQHAGGAAAGGAGTEAVPGAVRSARCTTSGTDLILNFIVDNFPAPVERPAITGKAGGQEVTRAISDTEPVSAFVFKTVADPFAGRVSYFKVCSGVVKNDANLQQRPQRRRRAAGAHRLPDGQDHPAGHRIARRRHRRGGQAEGNADRRHALPTRARRSSYPAVKLPEPSIAFAIEAKTRQDEDRMGNAIQRILEEDQSLRFYRDPQTKEFLLAGSGQQHVEVIVSRLKKRYNVDVALKAPKIPYRETIRGTADVQGRHKKQTGGHGQFGDCWIKMEPLPRGAKFEFVNDIFGGSIPRNYIPAVEKGIIEAAEKGYLAGYPVVDFRVTLYDGSYHDVDSSELSFKLAARKAFKAAMEQARPALLEPIMNVEIQAPVEYAGDLMGDLNSRRGRISGMDTRGGTQIVRAQVPMAEMLNYQNDLTR